MTKKPWFRGKKRGYGWGKPMGKEGWLVLVTYFLLIFCGMLLLGKQTPATASVIFSAQVIFATILLLVICFATGETARWQWKETKKSKK